MLETIAVILIVLWLLVWLLDHHGRIHSHSSGHRDRGDPAFASFAVERQRSFFSRRAQAA